MCPKTRGVRCDGEKLAPQMGYWSPTAHTGDTEAQFEADTELFECLTCASCNVTEPPPNGTRVTPASAFQCATGHAGVLCAKCEQGWYFKRKKCRRCDAEFVSSGAFVAIACLLGAALVHLLYKLVLRRYAVPILEHLHLVRRDLDGARYKRRRKLKRQRRRKRRKRKRGFGKQRGHNVVDDGEEEEEETSAAGHYVAMFVTVAVHAVHASVKSAKRGLMFGTSESFRILINTAKVARQDCFLEHFCGSKTLHRA